jgi:hypothetical protein
MNVGVDAAQDDALDAIWNTLCSASEKREEDPLSVMWRAYIHGKSKTQSLEKLSSGVGQHIYIGQYADDQTSLDYLNADYYHPQSDSFFRKLWS